MSSNKILDTSFLYAMIVQRNKVFSMLPSNPLLKKLDKLAKDFKKDYRGTLFDFYITDDCATPGSIFLVVGYDGDSWINIEYNNGSWYTMEGDLHAPQNETKRNKIRESRVVFNIVDYIEKALSSEYREVRQDREERRVIYSMIDKLKKL